MFNTNIEHITEMDLQALIDNSVTELKTLEYKAILPGNPDSERREFLADVSSFANSLGGSIVLGIVCDNSTGIPKTLDGITANNWDQEILRLDNMIRDGIKPRISGIRIKSIRLSNGRSALIVRTEKSWNPPHRVTFKGHDKFYSRSTNGKYALDVEELRNIFNLSATTAERIRNFRIDRINKILADDTPIPLLSLPRTVLHIVPLISINPGQVYDITYVYRFPDKLPTVQKLMDDRRYNVDGIITFSMEIKGRYYAYTQLFKNGIIESTNASLLEPSKAGLSIPGGLFESKLIQSFSAYLSLMKECSQSSCLLTFFSQS